MLVFGHVGITLGAAVLVNGAVNMRATHAAPVASQSRAVLQIANEPRARLKAWSIRSWFEYLGRFLDIRVLMVGSLVPDIIDKPISLFLTGNGRAYAHTLALTLLVFSRDDSVPAQKKNLANRDIRGHVHSPDFGLDVAGPQDVVMAPIRADTSHRSQNQPAPDMALGASHQYRGERRRSCGFRHGPAICRPTASQGQVYLVSESRQTLIPRGGRLDITFTLANAC